MATQYSAADVSVTIDGVLISELIDGDAITVEKQEDDSGGTQGLRTTTLYSRPSMLADVTINVMQGSVDNDTLTGICEPIVRERTGSVAIAIVDNFGTTVFSSSTAKPTKLPGMSFSTEPDAREWTFTAHIDVWNVGGNDAA
jgi:hypothetical protein